jgi:tripartite-type tricarboxylate transporter receptor subunit TctC
MSKLMKFARIALAVMTAAACTAAVADEAYPAKPVTIVVPFSPGGGTDTGARWIAQKLSERWKQAVVVDNKPGAAGMIGADFVARAKADGYTIMMSNAQVAVINPSLYKTMPYNAATAFVPISLVAELPLVLLVNPAVPATNTAEFIALAKAKPGELTYSSAGNGSSTHLAASLFENATGTKLVHVPYKGGGPAMQDLMAGVVNLTFLTVLESTGPIKGSKVKPIAVTSSTRSPALPNVPTLAESGIPGYFSISWIGLLAPAGTPKAIVERISKDVQEIVAMPDVKERFIAQGATPVGGTPAQFQALIDADSARYRKIIVDKNISATD